jgi:hypothetical protein
MPIVIKSFPSSRELFFWELIPVSSYLKNGVVSIF